MKKVLFGLFGLSCMAMGSIGEVDYNNVYVSSSREIISDSSNIDKKRILLKGANFEYRLDIMDVKTKNVLKYKYDYNGIGYVGKVSLQNNKKGEKYLYSLELSFKDSLGFMIDNAVIGARLKDNKQVDSQSPYIVLYSEIGGFVYDWLYLGGAVENSKYEYNGDFFTEIDYTIFNYKGFKFSGVGSAFVECVKNHNEDDLELIYDSMIGIRASTYIHEVELYSEVGNSWEIYSFGDEKYSDSLSFVKIGFEYRR